MLVFITTMPISVISLDGDICQTEGGWSKDVLPLEQDELLVQTILKEYKKRKSFVINDIFSIFFGVAPWFNNKICVLGPFFRCPYFNRINKSLCYKTQYTTKTYM